MGESRELGWAAKFDGLEPRHCEDITGIMASEIGPKSFGTFKKQALGLKMMRDTIHHRYFVECVTFKSMRQLRSFSNRVTFLRFPRRLFTPCVE